MVFRKADEIIYIGTDYSIITGRKGVITKIQPDGTYGISVEMPRNEPTQHLLGVPEEDLELAPQYVYRWRTEDDIHHKIYYAKGAASGQANIKSRRYGKTWVQRAKVEWEDV